MIERIKTLIVIVFEQIQWLLMLYDINTGTGADLGFLGSQPGRNIVKYWW